MSNVVAKSYQERWRLSTGRIIREKFIAVAKSIFNETSNRGEQVDTSDMFVSKTVVDGSEGQFFLHSLRQLLGDTPPPHAVRRQFLSYVIDKWRNKSETIGLCDVEHTIKIEYATLVQIN